MRFLPRLPRARPPGYSPAGLPQPSVQETPAKPPVGAEPFFPSIDQVLKTRYILRHKVYSGNGLPEEIVDLIIDEAEYWPSVETRMQMQATIGKDNDRSLVRSVPLCYDDEVSNPLALRWSGFLGL